MGTSALLSHESGESLHHAYYIGDPYWRTLFWRQSR